MAEQTGLKIYASPDVQGKISCRIHSRDGNEVFQRLLIGTGFEYRREGDFVYLGTRREMENLPKPLAAMGTRTYLPKHMSRRPLHITLEMNLSPLGRCVEQESGIVVQDVELALRDLDRLVPLLDVPGKRPKLDAFVFQHETESLRKRLELTTVAENRNVTLQELNPPEKKSETAPRIYTLSQRLDTFLMGLEDQKETKLISDRTLSEDLRLGEAMRFPFTLQLGEAMRRYGLEVVATRSEDGTLELAVDCRPDDGGESVSIRSTMEMERGWILQCCLANYHKPRDKKKPFAFYDPKVYVEGIVVLVSRLEEPPRPATDLTLGAIKFFAKQQEDWGYRNLSNASPEEAELAKSFIGTGLRLKNLANTPSM